MARASFSEPLIHMYVHIIEVHGHVDNLVTHDDDIYGEGPDGWVSPASKKANLLVVVRVVVVIFSVVVKCE